MAKKKKKAPKPEPRELFRTFRDKDGRPEELDMAEIRPLRAYKEAIYDINTNHGNGIKLLKEYALEAIQGIRETQWYIMFPRGYHPLPASWKRKEKENEY